MCDGRFAANSAGCGKFGGDDLAASDDLVDHGNRARRKEFYHTRGCLFSRYSFDTLSSRSIEKFCQWPHAFESVGGRPRNMPDAPSLRIGWWSASQCVMIVIFVKYIE